MISGSAGEGSSAVVGPTPTDPVESRKCARDLNTLSAAQKHTNEERGGSGDPGVRRPGAGRGLSCQHARRSFVPHCLLLPVLSGNIVNRKPPRGGGFLSIKLPKSSCCANATFDHSPTRHLGSFTAANSVPFDLIVSCR